SKGANPALSTTHDYSQDHPVESALLAARVLVRAGRPQEAITALSDAQRKNADTDLLIALADLEFKSGKQTVAISSLNDWIKSHPQAILARLELGNIALSSGNLDDAASEF